MIIRLTEYNEQTKMDLDAVPTATVPTVVPPTVRTETVRTDNNIVRTEKDAVRTDEVSKGKFNKYHDVYPERIEVCFKRGAKSQLKEWCEQRGFSSVSTMIRSAIKYAIKHPEFVNGWDK